MTASCSRPHEDRGGGSAGSEARLAILTPLGRGGLAVVGVGGPGAVPLVARLFTPRGRTALAERPVPAIVFGTWRATDDGPGEDVVVVRRAADHVEIHCHGGLAAVESILASLARHGGRRLAWSDWLRAGGTAEIDVEAHEALAMAGGPKAARILSRQLDGRLEVALGRVRSLDSKGRGAADALIARLLRAARVGLRLTRPWRVVVTGPTNAGKSSLVNAIAGHARAIVSPEAGTTRDLLETRLVLDGWEVDLVDTAGLRPADAAAGEVERQGMARAIAACAAADLVLQVRDVRQASGPPAIVTPGELSVVTKADLTTPPGRAAAGDSIWTSAVTGHGVGDLVARIVRRLVPEEADDPSLLDGAVPFTERQVRLIERLRDGGGPTDDATADRLS